MEKQFKKRDVALFLLSLVFSIALMFAFTELPKLLDPVVGEVVGSPGFDQGTDQFSMFKSDLYISSYNLRVIGYICLAFVIIAIITGFATKKSGWAWAGAFVLFLPVFGQFALSMFFLAGLGILRVSWMPFMDLSVDVLSLGDVIYLPLDAVLWFFRLFDIRALPWISYLLIFSGGFLFVWGVFLWFQIRSGEGKVVKSFIYKISRHPQYLGWILWSYGMMLYSSGINNMKKSWSIPASLPWLLGTMVIIGACLLEEIKMLEVNGKEYEQYRKKTPFLFPAPKWFSGIFKAPVRIFFKKEMPRKKSEAVIVTIFYTIIFILASAPFVDFTKNNSETAEDIRQALPSGPEFSIEETLSMLEQAVSRRDIFPLIDDLALHGKETIPHLITLLSDSRADVREFAANKLGKLNAVSAGDSLITLLNDESVRVTRAAISALSDLKYEKSAQYLIRLLNSPEGDHFRWNIYGAFENIRTPEIWLHLVSGARDKRWYVARSALNAMININQEKAMPEFWTALDSDIPEVRRAAVMIILEKLPEGAEEHLTKVFDEEDFETRFYAKEAYRLLKEKKQGN